MMAERPPVIVRKRYYDLDALRAVAMLLGLVLHAVMSFVPAIPWLIQDSRHPAWELPARAVKSAETIGIVLQDSYSPFHLAFHVIHGFRMPLFFVISGFFTAMLWQQRGTSQMVRHRIRRILIPMIVLMIALWPIMIGLGVLGSMVNGESKENHILQNGSVDAVTLHDLRYEVYDGQWSRLPDFEQHVPDRSGLVKGGRIDIELSERKDHYAMVFEGQMEIGKPGVYTFELASDDGSRLYVNGAERIDIDGMHGVIRRESEVELDTGMTDLRVEYFEHNGDAELSVSVAGPDEKRMLLTEGPSFQNQGEREVEAFFKKADSEFERLPGWMMPIVITIGILFGMALIPVFHHLWFLYYLLWMVMGLVLVGWLAGKYNLKKWPAWMVTSPLRWFWLIPLSFVAQLCMWQTFGPDTYTGIMPWPPKLLYYAVFFGYGVLCYGEQAFEGRVGRYWYGYFLIALPVLIVGLISHDQVRVLINQGVGQHRYVIVAAHAVSSLCAVLYAWLMIFGLIGFFRMFFPRRSRAVRYVSDASYWLYVAHLPLIVFLQIAVSQWNLASGFKFLMIVVLTSGGLLVVYEYAVRYTLIGTMLNGKRVRNTATDEG